MKKSKVLMIVAIAIMAIVAVGSVSFAAWSITTKTESGINVSIASPVELSANHNATNSDGAKVLIPTGMESEFDNANVVTSYKTGEITTSLANAETKKIYLYATVTVGGVANTDVIVNIAGVDTAVSHSADTATEIGVLTNAAMTVSLPADAAKETFAGKQISITLNFLVK